MKFRHAKQSDKNNALKFCTDTFEWGDCIEEVWDDWNSDPNGYLTVAEEEEEEVSELIQISDADLLEQS